MGTWGSVLINHLLLVIPVIPMSLYKIVSSFATKTHTHKRARAYTHSHSHARTHTRMHARVHTVTHTHTHTHTVTHTHTHTQSDICISRCRRSWISRSQTLQSELSQRVKVNLYFKSGRLLLAQNKKCSFGHFSTTC